MSKSKAIPFSQQYSKRGIHLNELQEQDSISKQIVGKLLDTISRSQKVQGEMLLNNIDESDNVKLNGNLSKILEEDRSNEKDKQAISRIPESQDKDNDFTISNSQLENICMENKEENDKFTSVHSENEKEINFSENDFALMIFSTQKKEIKKTKDNNTVLSNRDSCDTRLSTITKNIDSNRNIVTTTHLMMTKKDYDNKKKTILNKENAILNDIDFPSQELNEIVSKEILLENKKSSSNKNDEVEVLKKSFYELTKKFEEKCIEMNFLKEKIYKIEFENYKNNIEFNKILKEKIHLESTLNNFKIENKFKGKECLTNSICDKDIRNQTNINKFNNCYTINEINQRNFSFDPTINNNIITKVPNQVINKPLNKTSIRQSYSNKKKSPQRKYSPNELRNIAPQFKDKNSVTNELKDDEFDKMLENLKENKDVKCCFELTTAKKYNFDRDDECSNQIDDDLPKFRNNYEDRSENNNGDDEYSILLKKEELDQKNTKQDKEPSFISGLNSKVVVHQPKLKESSRLNKLLEEMNQEIIFDDLEGDNKQQLGGKEKFSKHFPKENLVKNAKNDIGGIAKNPQIIISNSYDNILKLNPEKVNFTNADIFKFLCTCTSLQSNFSCSICDKKRFINLTNFNIFFKAYCKKNNTKLVHINSEWMDYQYRLSVWKYFSLSKYENEIFCIERIASDIFKKYNIIHNQGKRSFLTKVAEKDSLVNRHMVLLVLNIISKFKLKIEKNKNKQNYFYILELSDGYKSVFSKIFPVNPLFNLVRKNQILTGMKLSIGITKIENLELEGTDIYITLNYNSVSRAENTAKLGPCKNIYLIRSLFSLREDGGEISMIDVIILKKYNYYYYDYISKKRISAERFERNNSGDEETFVEDKKKSEDKKLILNFKVIVIDSLLLYEYLNRTKKTRKYDVKKSLEKAYKKAVIELGNNLEVFQNITVGTFSFTKVPDINS